MTERANVRMVSLDRIARVVIVLPLVSVLSVRTEDAIVQANVSAKMDSTERTVNARNVRHLAKTEGYASVMEHVVALLVMLEIVVAVSSVRNLVHLHHQL